MEAQPYDVVIVGGGAPGLSAALVLGRARRRVLVIDAGSPRNAPAAHMQGYVSRDGMPPAEFLAIGRAEVAGAATRAAARCAGVDPVARCAQSDTGRGGLPSGGRRTARSRRPPPRASVSAWSRHPGW